MPPPLKICSRACGVCMPEAVGVRSLRAARERLPSYVENKAGLTGQTVPRRRIPGHWPYPGPEELAETEPVGPDAWTFLFLLITTPRAR